MTRNMFSCVVVAMAAAALLTGCGQREPAGHGSPAPPIPSPSAPSSTTQFPLPSPGPEANEPTTPVLGDGRYPVYLTAVDTSARTLTFDVIQYLTGAEAAEAFHQDHPDITEGPLNGYYIRNQNPRLRTLPVRQHIPVRVLWLGAGLGSDTISFGQLPGYLAKNPGNHKYLSYDPFWLTVHAGHVDAITEQYIP